VVVVAELLVEEIRNRRPSPPRDRHGVVVDQPDHRHHDAGRHERDRKTLQVRSAEQQRAAEHVTADRQSIVMEGVDASLRAGRAAEHRLRDQRVDDEQPEERQR
jgi:hypothetical protein